MLPRLSLEKDCRGPELLAHVVQTRTTNADEKRDLSREFADSRIRGW